MLLGACMVFRAAHALPANAAQVGLAPSGDTGVETAATPARSGEVKLVVYTTSWCSACRRAKKWMTEQGIAYEERDVESSPENARHLRAISPRGAVPTFDVGGKVIVGFAEHELTSALRASQIR
jgi:glutaredoxin